MNKSKTYTTLIGIIIGILVINYIANQYHFRLDLTQDQRYTLSNQTKSIVENIDDPIAIKVYLEGDFPAEFKRIQQETKQLLEEFQVLNSNIQYAFINPLTKNQELIEQGLQPSKLSVQEEGQVSEAIIFPWATISYKDKVENVSLLSHNTGNSQEEQLENSIENLEYEFSSALSKVTSEKEKKIAILRGNGELEDIYLYSFLKKLGEHYHLAEFTLDSVKSSPQKTLEDLTEFDLAIIAKPKNKFSEKDKFTIDQFITNNGKTLWLLDNVHAELDSLMNTGKMLVYNRDLNLTDLLFQYGVRIKYNINKDLYCNTIRLASGNLGNQTQFQDFKWPYYPLVISNNNHPIVSDLDPVFLKFPSSIDTLKNPIKKTILIESSPLTKSLGTPIEVSLNEISEKPIKESYSNSNQIYGVLLEGSFKSAYANRIKPFESSLIKEQSTSNKMIIISDGDVAANEVYKGEPLELNIDKWTNRPYGNLDFLLNAVHYLLDDSGVLDLRSKKLQIQFLDKEKAYEERRFWQAINLILPMVILLAFGLIFNYFRKRKYTS